MYQLRASRSGFLAPTWEIPPQHSAFDRATAQRVDLDDDQKQAILAWYRSNDPLRVESVEVMLANTSGASRTLWLGWLLTAGLVALFVLLFFQIYWFIAGLRRAIRDRRLTRHERCPACGYSLAGLPGGVCPECGRETGDA